jgi:hypothetical protein
MATCPFGEGAITYIVHIDVCITRKDYHMYRHLFALLFIFIMTSSIVFAQSGVDDQGNPNDPAVNESANACYSGGAMEGKCDSEWAWMCGWHLIRLDPENDISRAEFPAACSSLLPPRSETPPAAAPSVPSAPAGCYTNGIDSLQWTGGAGPSTVTTHFGTVCGGTADPRVIAYALTKAQADAMCSSTTYPFGGSLGTFYNGGQFFFC